MQHIIIDGYNLLYASGILGRGRGPGALERARTALLNFLSESLPADQLTRTTVVFDASEAPWGVARTQQHQGITIHFASREEDADTMIEDLVKKHSTPRQLVVVSSDHRLHRAARKRKAEPVDSDRWFANTIRARQERLAPDPLRELPKPEGPFSQDEVEFWLKKFGGESDK